VGQYFTAQGSMLFAANAADLLSVVPFTGVTTVGSPEITDPSTVVGLQVGQLVVGAGIPAGTYIVGIDISPNTVTLSANATANSTTAAPTDIWAFGQESAAIPFYEHLLVGNVPQGPYVAWSDLVEASYDGYVPQEWTYPVVVACQDGANVTISTEAMTWMPTDYAVGNQITGRAVTVTLPGATGPILIANEQFVPALELTATGQGFRTIPTLSFALDNTEGPSTPILT
jgi:hypothetical protein